MNEVWGMINVMPQPFVLGRVYRIVCVGLFSPGVALVHCPVASISSIAMYCSRGVARAGIFAHRGACVLARSRRVARVGILVVVCPAWLVCVGFVCVGLSALVCALILQPDDHDEDCLIAKTVGFCGDTPNAVSICILVNEAVYYSTGAPRGVTVEK